MFRARVLLSASSTVPPSVRTLRFSHHNLGVGVG